MDLVIDLAGQVRCLYDEAIPLASLGDVAITRASQVDPDDHGQWWADLAPSGGPVLGPYALRSYALAAESSWLLEHRLLAPTGHTTFHINIHFLGKEFSP